MYPTNPAAIILPVVERVAPERLADVFWRAVALHPRIETDREDQIRTSYLGFECMLLARYDREVSAALFEPVDSYLRALAARTGPAIGFTPSLIVAEGCLDPRAAVATRRIADAAWSFPAIEPGSPGTAPTGRSPGRDSRKKMATALELIAGPAPT